jgi:hypothetical protein
MRRMGSVEQLQLLKGEAKVSSWSIKQQGKFVLEPNKAWRNW